MTSVSKAFKVVLPEDQGTVCLTEQGLQALRQKINQEIGTPLTATCPAGVSQGEWELFQAAMASEHLRRQENERKNAYLRGNTDTQTARNIVDVLNQGSQAPMPTMRTCPRLGQIWPTTPRAPRKDVRVWRRDALALRSRAAYLVYDRDTNRYQFRTVVEGTRADVVGTSRVYEWSGVVEDSTRNRNRHVGDRGAWTALEMYPVPVKTPRTYVASGEQAPDPQVAHWSRESGWSEGDVNALHSRFTSDGGMEYALRVGANRVPSWAGPLRWAGWDVVGPKLIAGKTWTETDDRYAE